MKNPSKNKQHPPKRARTHGFGKKIHVVLLVLLLGTIGSYVFFQNGAESEAASKPRLFVSPSSKRVKKGTTFTVNVYENSYTHKINAVQANLAYSKDKLTFVSTSRSSSRFEISKNSKGIGVIRITRAHVGSLKGLQLVTKVKFKAKKSGTATVKFTSGSAIVRSTDNKDVLVHVYGGKYTLY